LIQNQVINSRPTTNQRLLYTANRILILTALLSCESLMNLRSAPWRGYEEADSRIDLSNIYISHRPITAWIVVGPSN
jgi:hypothetical protein